ncbi:MAG: phenylalanine--tRNA ligase subunit beta [Enhygromyxa sp.]
MLISCAWLNELLEGAPIALGPVTDQSELSAERVAERLTSLGLEVEGLAHFDLPKVIVGEIRELTKHPKADKLNVVQLFDGAATVQVVCGASNLPPVGGKVAFAPVGTTLPGGLTIGARELRGVASQGMICSEEELDIGADAEGIMVLPSDWPAGALLREQIPGIVDAVIDISVTPNRPDALGHLGVAIDLAVALGTTVRTPKRWTPPPELPSDEQLVTLAAPDRCGRYLGFGLEQVQVGRSPEWLRVRLHRVGLRAINDVVDITNYVLMETGQPLHAFDRDKLDEGRVVVRTAAPGEPITTLDDKQLQLEPDDLVIADASRPQALAGIMGGAGSAVSEASDRLLLEIAWFEPKGVRRSGRRHDLHTDSRARFERGVDHGDKLELAAHRALELLRSLCGAQCVAGCEVLGERPSTPTIRLRPERISALLGMPIDPAEAARILLGLGVELDQSEAASPAPGFWRCVPPSFRPDLEREVDLIEEVMRHHGLDDLPAEHSRASEQREAIAEDPRRRRADELRDALRGAGLHEHLSLAFSSEAALASVLGPGEGERLVRLRNPLRIQASVMRSHMLPGLLEAVALNHARHDRPLELFEIGRIYRWPTHEPETSGSSAAIDRKLPEEPTRAAVIMARRVGGDRASSPVTRQCAARLLGALESLGILGILGPMAELRPAATLAWLHPGVQIGVWLGELQIGVLGELHPDIVVERDLGELEIAYAELWLERLPTHFDPAYVELARFPSTARDLSLDLADEIAAAEVLASVREAFESAQASGQGEAIVLGSSADPRTTIETIEEYRGKGVAPGRRALLLRLHYRAHERSVTDSEVQPLHEAIVEAACTKLRTHDPELRVR